MPEGQGRKWKMNCNVFIWRCVQLVTLAAASPTDLSQEEALPSRPCRPSSFLLVRPRCSAPRLGPSPALRRGLGPSRRLAHDDLVDLEHRDGRIHGQTEGIELGHVDIEDSGLD